MPDGARRNDGDIRPELGRGTLTDIHVPFGRVMTPTLPTAPPAANRFLDGAQRELAALWAPAFARQDSSPPSTAPAARRNPGIQQ